MLERTILIKASAEIFTFLKYAGLRANKEEGREGAKQVDQGCTVEEESREPTVSFRKSVQAEPPSGLRKTDNSYRLCSTAAPTLSTRALRQ
jgi:hypothetical protein